MRKWIFLLIAVCLIPFAINAWALPDNVQPSEYSGSQSVKSIPGTVYSANVNYKGVTAGDTVQLLDGGSSGTVRITCTASAANGTCPNHYTVGALFQTNIYLKETKAGSGTFATDIQFF